MRNVKINADLDGVVEDLRHEKKLAEITESWLQRHKEFFWLDEEGEENELLIHFTKVDEHKYRAFVDFYGCHYWRAREEGADLSCALRNSLNHLEAVMNKMEEEGGPIGHCPYDSQDYLQMKTAHHCKI